MLSEYRGSGYIALISTVVVLFCAGGCGGDTEELEQKILARDPSFQDQLDKRNDLRQQIALHRSSYEKKVNNIDGQIAALRERKKMEKRDFEMAVEKIRRRIEPVKREMRTALMDKQRRLEVARMQLKNVQRDIAEIEALIEKKDKLAFTREEINTWNDRLTSLVEKKSEIVSREQELRRDIETMKLKMKVMRL
jgi:chromosome segregation ATPase